MILNQVKAKLGKIIVYSLIVYNTFVKFLISLNIVPHAANYVTDLFLVIGIAVGLIDFYKLIKHKQAPKELIYIVCSLFVLFVFSFLTSIIGKSSIILFAWHVRNNYRVFLYLILCSIYFRRKDIEQIFNIGFVLMIVHGLLSTYQLFDLYGTHKLFFSQDYINGLFGVIKGYNTFSIVFLLCITCYFVFTYLCENRYKLKMVISLFICGWVTAIAELKIIYVIFALLLGAVVVLSLIKIRNIRALICSTAICVCTMFSLLSMQFFYPQFDNFFLNVDVLKNYLFDVSYGSNEREEIVIVDKDDIENNNIGNNDIENNGTVNNEEDNTSNNIDSSVPGVNRFSTFTIIPQYFFDDTGDYVFGLGAGNAEYSQIDLLCSDFYEKHGDVNYIKFSSSVLLLEIGIVGLALYICQFLVLIAIYIKEILASILNKNKLYNAYVMLSLFMAAIAAVMVIYDASLRSEAAYFYGFELSLGLVSIISSKDMQNDELTK